jgi:hypothetical protein
VKKAIADAIVLRMQNDTGAGGLNASDGATGGFHQGKAPEESLYPRVHFKTVTGIPHYVTVGEAYRALFVQFLVYASDPINGGESGSVLSARLNARVQDLFTDPDGALPIAGHELIYCRPERELSSATEFDQAVGRDVFSEGCVIEFWTAEV